MHIVFFHRNPKAGFSINKVTQIVIRDIKDKEEYNLPNLGPSPLAVFRNMWFVFRRKRKDSINHVTGDVQYAIIALLGCKSVLTCHDTVSLDYRKLPMLKRRYLEWLWYRLPLMKAGKVVAISEETKRCLMRYTSRRDIVVIYDAIDPLFSFHHRVYNEIPQVLIIGTAHNKNLIRTFEALKGLTCKVHIVGKLSDEQRSCLKKNKINFENSVGLSDVQIYDAYIRCDIVSFISLFEGFGMIIVEANKVGRPVICSNIAVLKEVANDAAMFVDPYNVEEMHKGFERLLLDQKLQRTLVERGVENVKRFEKDIIQDQWLNLYESFK